MNSRKRLVGNDDMIDGQWEYLELQRQNRWTSLNRLFEGTTPENSRGIGRRMKEAMNDERNSNSNS